MPLRKSDVVIGRYLYALCIIVINGIIAALVAYIVSLLTNNAISSIEFLIYLSVGFLYACLMTAVIFPLYFKFSFSKVYIFSNLPFYLLFVILIVLTRKTNVLQQAGPAVQNLTSSLTVAAIGLGLGLFLLSAYFTPGSYERKGPGTFLKDRLLRLGIHTLVYVFIISPMEVWGSHQITHKSMGNLFALDQMWFVVMLLVFDLGYLAWRTIVKNRTECLADDVHKKLTFPKVAVFTLALVAASYLLRIVIPYGIPVFEFPSLGYLAQYLSFFLIGMLAFRRDWLRTVPGSIGQLGFVLAVLATVILFPTAVFIGSGSRWIGYGSWQSAVFALWDSIFAVGISLALITFFRRFLDGGKKLGRFLSQHSFAVYVIHVPVIIFLIMALSDLQMLPQLKFCLAAVVGLPLCFGIAWLIRKIPYVKKIL